MEELWKAAPGFEGLYEVSNLGRVRITPGRVTSSARFPHREWKTKVLKTKRLKNDKRKDERISLWKDGAYHDFLVSRLVAMTWVGVPPEGMTVNHIDGNNHNNAASNLEWVTLADNIKKGFAAGLFDSFQIPVSLVNEAGEKKDFHSLAEASRWLGRSEKYISCQISRKRYYATSSDGVRYTIPY